MHTRDTEAMLADNTKKIELRNCVTRLEQERTESSSLRDGPLENLWEGGGGGGGRSTKNKTRKGQFN